MAKGNSNAKENLMIFLSFIPFVNSITLFHMNGKVKNKKWSMLAWIVLMLNIVLISALIFSATNVNTDIAETPTDNQPSIEDYLSYDYNDKYTYEEYSKMPEYYEYEKALKEWYSSKEVKAVEERNTSFRTSMRGIAIASGIALIITNLVTFFYVFSQKDRYLNKKEILQNKKAVASRLADMQADKTPPTVSEIKKAAEQNTMPAAALDINTAAEEEIAALPGLSIIDAKRAISYREQNGGFKSTDEFFEVISAKPHIVVRLQDVITLSDVPAKKSFEPSSKRAIDI